MSPCTAVLPPVDMINKPKVSPPRGAGNLLPKPAGHKDVKSTMVNTYVLNQGPKGVRSPIEDV